MNVPKGEYLSIAELGEVLNALATAAVKKEDSLDAEKTIGWCYAHFNGYEFDWDLPPLKAWHSSTS